MGASAQDITLTARDGDLVIDGVLLGYDGAYYRVESEFGELTVDGSGVTCEGEACPDTDAFVAQATFSGAETVGRVLMPPLIETYARRSGYDLDRRELDERSFVYTLRPVSEGGAAAVDLVFRLGTSAEGFADIIADEADLAMSVREITTLEAGLAREAGRGDLTDPRRSRVLALDALVPIAPAADARAAISFDELRSISSGEGDGVTALHLPSSQTGLGEAFDRIVLNGNRQTQGVVRHFDGDALIAAVESNRDAVGIVALSALGDMRGLGILGACGTMSNATVESIKAEDYPLTVPVFLYAPARRLPDPVRRFIDYVMSPAAQDVVRGTGFVDQLPVEIPPAAHGERMINAILQASDETNVADLRSMVRTLDGKSRLSISFRFEDGSADLDAQSRSNVLLLSQAIERGLFEGRTLSFVGFSDALGPASINRRLSLRRARTVRDAIETALGGGVERDIDFATEAFGEALPMACEDTDWGRRINRRVEVWLD